ncbi:MAG: 30S ribosomal protein S16 [Gammaproteobacteria bacterium]|jgi:small subunit ribosomal protein S16
MVTIRLARGGSKKNPYYYVTVADHHRAHTGKFLERVGFYNPTARGKEEKLRIDLERVKYWQSHGALASPRVETLLKQAAAAPVAVAA